MITHVPSHPLGRGGSETRPLRASTRIAIRHPSNSPIYGGLRGLTHHQTHSFPHITIPQIPHYRADFATSPFAPGEGEGKSENAKTNLLSPA